MMQIACRKRQRIIATFLSIASLVVPMTASAVTASTDPASRGEVRSVMQETGERRTERMDDAKERMQAMFCSRFTDAATKIGSGMAEGRGRFEKRRDNRLDDVEDGRSSRDAKFEDKRSDADGDRSEMYANLEAKADTDAKKEALSDFKKTIEEAVDDRRDAVDAALLAFRTGVDAAIAGRKDDMQGAVDTFQAAVDAALAKAKSDCENGTAPATVRTNFLSALEAARKTLQSDHQESERVGEQVKALAETRRIAIKKALDDFKATVEAATLELKKAFGEDGDA